MPEYLIEYSVPKRVDTKLASKKVIDSKEVEVIETVSSIIEEKFALLSPNRRTRENGEFFYAKNVNDFMKKGLMTRIMLSKRYDNDGGPFTEEENKALKELEEKKGRLLETYFKNKVEAESCSAEEKTLKEEENSLVLTEIAIIQQKVQDIYSPYKELFSLTAESKARDRAIIWWMFSILSQYDEAKKAYVPFFTSSEYDVNSERLDAIEKLEDPFHRALIDKTLFYLTYWLSGGSFSKDAIDLAEREFKSSFPQYYKTSIDSPNESSTPA